jgi:hypothetical protein
VIDEDVHEGNVHEYWYLSNYYGDALDYLKINPIIFDETGEILKKLFGSQSTLLGVAEPDMFNTTNTLQGTSDLGILNLLADSGLYPALDGMEVTFGSSVLPETVLLNGQMIINCACPKNQCSEERAQEIRFTILHEMGHLIGLSHSQLNHEFNLMQDADALPVMYPQHSGASRSWSLHEDDKRALTSLYVPSLSPESCSLSVPLVDENKNPLRCYEISAHPLGIDGTPETSLSFSVISGGESSALIDAADESTSNCLEDDSLECSRILLRNLDPTRVYWITATPLRFNGASGISPCTEQPTDSETPAKLVAIVTPEACSNPSILPPTWQWTEGVLTGNQLVYGEDPVVLGSYEETPQAKPEVDFSGWTEEQRKNYAEWLDYVDEQTNPNSFKPAAWNNPTSTFGYFNYSQQKKGGCSLDLNLARSSSFILWPSALILGFGWISFLKKNYNLGNTTPRTQKNYEKKINDINYLNKN